MYQLLAILAGIIVAAMISINSLLSSSLGNVRALFIIHVIGLITVIIYMVITKTKMKKYKKIQPLFYTAGAIGIINIFLSNISFAALGAALTVGIGLYGQLFMSAIVDHYGVFGRTKNSITPIKLLGLIIMALGIVIMIVL